MATPNPMPVPFHGNTLYVLDHNGEPFVPMKPVVEGIGMDWRAQATKLRSNQARWGVVIITTPSGGGKQGLTCLPLRKLPGWLMSIHANKVDVKARPKVIQFQNECDDVLWRHWQKTHPSTERLTHQPDQPADSQWLEGRFGPHRIRAHVGCARWTVCADDIAVAVGYRFASDLTRLAPDDSYHPVGEGEAQVTLINVPGVFAALARSQKHSAPAMSHYLEKEIFGAEAIMATETPTRGDRDYARQLFEEDPAAFLGDRQWLLRADQEGNLHARAMQDGETIVQMEELGQVMDAFSTLEGFVNRRELKIAFPVKRH